MTSKSFNARLSFFKDDPLYREVKPYGFKYPPNEDFPDTNIKSEDIDDVPIQDIRAVAQCSPYNTPKPSFSIEQHGFTVAHIANRLSYQEYFDPDKVIEYFHQLEVWLQQHLNARMVKVFRHHIRKRHVNWPHKLEAAYEFDQPTTHVHIDATREGCVQEMQMKHGHEFAEEHADRRYQWFNFWKPLRAPATGLNDWPLVLCDASTVDGEVDTTPADLVYPMYATENTQVYYRSRYKWYYLSDHQLDEVLVFKQADSEVRALPGVPHCSVYNPLAPTDEAPRESIEVRAMAYF